MDKQIVNLTIFLIKDYVREFNECLKPTYTLHSSKLKREFGLNGAIYYCDSSTKPPKWKTYVDTWSQDTIAISDNASNKALLLVNINNRIMAIVFGYGRSFLKEECIERNFGLKVALNVIDPNKMRSVNAATIEDMVVTTQRQASYGTSQDEFGLNVINDIMKGITGEPYDRVYGNHISGKDSLVVSVLMDLQDLQEKLSLYYSAYTEQRYKRIGFEWVDNIAEVRDSILIESLDLELSTAIENNRIGQLHIAPPETTDWDRIIGFCYSGMGKKTEEADNYKLNLDISEYLEKIKPNTNVYQKLHRDKLYAMTSDGTPFVICNVYSALVFHAEYEGENYMLCSGAWYRVEKSFFDQVNTYIQTQIKISEVHLPDCPNNMCEGDYNDFVSKNNDNYCLMDRKMVSVAGGPKKIEACDIFDKDKKFIHVKNKGQSAQLSHLFAQGKVSAECFISDETFRKQVSDIIEGELGEKVFDYTQKPQSNEYEVIYAIIDDNDSNLMEKLPFFSKVNLMLTAQDLDRMHFRMSVCLVKKTSME